ncbi:MAG: LysR family transcriptional regulator, partial [Boseongicola sp.]
DQSWQEDWNIWARRAGVDLGSAREGPSYSLYSLALEEAKSGAGILIGHECLVEATLRAGDLIRPFSETAVTGKSLIVEFPENAASRETAKGLLALLSE